MKIVEMNTGKKINYQLEGTKLDFADGALRLDLARYQRDYTVTKDIMVDREGGLTTGKGCFYAAQIEIPPAQYKEKEIVVPVEQTEEEKEWEYIFWVGPSSEEMGQRVQVIREELPLDTDQVILRLFPIDGIEII